MKDTKIIEIKSVNDIELVEAARILREGGTVAFPTETVYGLGANALIEKAVNQIFVAKGRPDDNPLIVHVASKDDVDDLITGVSNKAKKLMDAFWPGPLTLIFKKGKLVADNVTAGLDSLAIRIPSHPIANKLIELAGVPIAAPSANISGKPSPTEGKHVVLDLVGKVDCIIISDQSEVGLESTIMDMTQDPPMLLRPGGVTIENIEGIIGEIAVDPSLEEKLEGHIKPRAPGMKYIHYSPKAEVIVIQGNPTNLVNKINELKEIYKGKKIGVMCSDEILPYFLEDIHISLGSKSKMEDIAANLFKALREFDEFGVDIVLAEGYDTLGIGKAIMNRLNKAAGFNIVKV